VAAASSVVVISAALASPRPAAPRATPDTVKSHESPWLAPAAAGPQPTASAPQSPPTHPPQPGLHVPPALTAAARPPCPAAPTPGVERARPIGWLQSAGKVVFGPVRAEPGPPGSAHATPRGTFQVSWKAGPGFISNIYHDPMPWAVFFAAGGIAFHGGSLT